MKTARLSTGHELALDGDLLGVLEALYREVMNMPQEKVNTTLQPVLDRIMPLYDKGGLSKDEEDYWAARAARLFNQPGKIDRGIFSIYLFNLVCFKPGEAIFQDAGLPHAYLEGQMAEIMAKPISTQFRA